MQKTLVALLLLLPTLSRAAENPERYRIEILASLWRMNTDGRITADGSPIDFKSDLGVRQHRNIFDGRLTFQYRHKHRLVLEGLPIAVRGLNTVSRNITYFGQTFSVSDTLKSSAQMNYIYLGYHHDWISNPMGHLGTSIGAAYLGLGGSIQGLQSGIDKSKNTPFGLPLAGLDFRVFPIPGKSLLEIEGYVRGLPAGSYGHWVEGSLSGGARLGPIGLLVGYREMFVDFHETGATRNGINLRLRGPIASVLWSW